jgi:hypothetical protein
MPTFGSVDFNEEKQGVQETGFLIKLFVDDTCR